MAVISVALGGVAAGGRGAPAGGGASDRAAADWAQALAHAAPAGHGGGTDQGAAGGGGRVTVDLSGEADPFARLAGVVAYARQTPEQRRQTEAAVDGIYRQVLGRGVDPAGLAAAEQELSRGHTLDEVRAHVASSQEAADRTLDAMLAAARANGGAQIDPGRVALIEDARSAVDQSFTARAGNNPILAALAMVRAHLDLTLAARPADERDKDKMLETARRFVEAAYAASGRGDWNLVQTYQTAADVSLQIAAKPEGERVKTTERFMHKKVKHDITVDPTSADPFATFSDHSKGEDVGAYVEAGVGVVLTVASFVPGVNTVAAPLAVAWNVAHAAKSVADGDALGGALGLAGSAAGLAGAQGLVRAVSVAQGLRGAVQGIEHGDLLAAAASAAGGLGGALGADTDLGRALVVGSALASAGVAASGGDWQGALSAAGTAAAGAFGSGLGAGQTAEADPVVAAPPTDVLNIAAFLNAQIVAAPDGAHGITQAGIAEDLEALGGGVPRSVPTKKGATQFIFPNGMILRFDTAPGQYLKGQSPHLNLEFPGKGNIHIPLK